jgi:hypothetical protein
MARLGTSKCGYCIGPLGAILPHCNNPDGRCDCPCTGKPQPEPEEASDDA